MPPVSCNKLKECFCWKDLRSFNPATGEWCTLPSMTVPRSQMGITILERHLYVVGGTNKQHEVLQSVERYSFDTVQRNLKLCCFFFYFILFSFIITYEVFHVFTEQMEQSFSNECRAHLPCRNSSRRTALRHGWNANSRSKFLESSNNDTFGRVLRSSVGRLERVSATTRKSRRGRSRRPLKNLRMKLTKFQFFISVFY